jgi:hypothetical protein
MMEKASFNQTDIHVRYRLVAQNRGDKLVIEIVEQKLYMIKTACEILKMPGLINGFSLEHAAQIGFIAGMQIAQ